MKKSYVSNIVLPLDIIMCICWFITIDYTPFFKTLLWSFPLLRLWLAFLIYRNSRMAIYPIGMLAILNIIVLFASSECTYELYLIPIAKLLNSIGHLTNWNVEGILATIQNWINGNSNLGVEVSFFGFWSMMLFPCVLYAYRFIKKQLLPSSLGTMKSLGFCMYLFVIAYVIEAFLPHAFCVSGSVIIIIWAIALIPFIFYKSQYDKILTRLEITILLALALLTWGYLCGFGFERKAVLTTLFLPITFYALVNWYYKRKITYKETAFIVLASSCFWFSQYGIGLFRVLLLLLSLALVVMALFNFVRETRKWMIGIGMVLCVGLFIPILCIGYNPYSVLHASRMMKCEEYHYSPNGLLFVDSEKGMGIRDRYELILPAEYARISILDSRKPYFKVQTKDDIWQIYDIERKQFVTDESIFEISADELPGVYRVRTQDGSGYLVLPNYYRKNGEDATPEKLLLIKREIKPESIESIRAVYYNEFY